MAGGFKLAELFVNIVGNDAPLNATLGAVHRKLLGFSSAFGSMNVPLWPFVAGIGAAGAAIGYVTREAGDLEKAFSQIRKTTGLAGPDMDKLRKSLEHLATTMAGVSLDEILGIASMAGRLGIEGVEGITAYTSAIARIRIALDDIPAEEAATNIARILNVFHLGPSEALSFASALNKLDDTSTATGRDILYVTQILSGTASTLGLTAQQTLALSTALKDAGVHSEVAGSAFSQILAKMATDTTKFAKVAGASVGDFSKTLRADPLKALMQFVQGIGKLEKLEQFKALDQIGLDGVRTSGSLLQLLTVIDKVGSNVAVANEEWKTHASIEREVALQAETTWAQLQKLGNTVSLLASDIGALLLPVVKDMGAEVGMMATAFRDNFDSIRESTLPTIEALRSAVATMGVVMRNTESTWALSVLNMAEPFDNLITRIQHFGDVIVTVFSYAFENIGKLAEGALLTVGGIVDTNMKLIARIPGYIKTALAGGKIDIMGDIEKDVTNALKVIGGDFPELKLPELKLNTEGFDLARQEIMDRIESREMAALTAKPLEEAAKAGAFKKQADAGTGLAPAKDTKAFFSDPAAWAKKIQEGVFGKDDSAKKTAKFTELAANGIQQLVQGNKAQKMNPGFAVGPP